MDSPTSDTPRQSLLGSINFLNRNSRPRASTTTTAAAGVNEPHPLPPPIPMPSMQGHRRRPAAAANVPALPPTTPNGNNALANMLRRRRSVNAMGEREQRREARPELPASTGTGPTHRIRLVPHLESLRSLHFEAISRDVRQGDLPLRIGRFTEHSGSNSNKLAFKSKVVSRGHAEVWFDSGTFYIKDTKSSSGTFLNHIRLSAPNQESRPHPIKDGDVLQLGVDYQGGTEEIYRCVKMRVELGREWQAGINAFNSNALQQLKALSSDPSTKAPKRPAATSSSTVTRAAVTDCCICLCQVTVCQALFIAPCSHVYHYKCIRPLLQMHHPGFSCPLCRTFADLEADVESEVRDPDPDPEEAIADIPLNADALRADGEGDIDMALEDVEENDPEDGVGPMGGLDDVDSDLHGGEGEADRTSSTGVGPVDTDGNPLADASRGVPSSVVGPITIPATRGAVEPVEAGATEATPLNNTYMAAFPRDPDEMNEAMGVGIGGGSRDAVEPGSDGGDSSNDSIDMVMDGAGSVGGKRKRRVGGGIGS